MGKNNTGDGYWRGKISNIIIYKKILSNTESQIINSYLSIKHNTFYSTNLILMNLNLI